MIHPWCGLCILVRAVLALEYYRSRPSDEVRLATQEMCSVRAFPCHWGEMIYDLFSNNSQPALCTGPSCQQTPGTTIPLHPSPSHIHCRSFSSASFLCWAKLEGASTVINTAYLYTCMSGNWNKGRDGGKIKKPWMTELQWCWIQSEAGRLCTPGPPGRWWGLRVT